MLMFQPQQIVSPTPAPLRTSDPAAPPVFEWALLPDQTLSLRDAGSRTGRVEFRLDAPSVYSGTHTVALTDLAAGPVCLVPAVISGGVNEGERLTVLPGLWVSLSSAVTLTGMWLRGDDETDNTGDHHVVSLEADGNKTITYRETVTDAAGTSHRASNGIAMPPPPPQWTTPEWRDAKGGYAGLASLAIDGSVTVSTKKGNRSGNPRVYFDVVPGKTYQLETAVEYGDASRIIGRLCDVSGWQPRLNVTVFDVDKPADQTQLIRSDVFTPTTDRIALHYVFVMDIAGVAKILPATRLKEVC